MCGPRRVVTTSTLLWIQLDSPHLDEDDDNQEEGSGGGGGGGGGGGSEVSLAVPLILPVKVRW